MPNTMKVLLLLVTVMFGLTACGSGGDQTGGETSNQDQTDAPATE